MHLKIMGNKNVGGKGLYESLATSFKELLLTIKKKEGKASAQETPQNDLWRNAVLRRSIVYSSIDCILRCRAYLQVSEKKKENK